MNSSLKEEQGVKRGQMKLMGISVRTNNKAEEDISKGLIFGCVMRYYHEGFAEKIPNRTKPGVTYCVYTDYESDYTGDYTYFIGEEVDSFKTIPEDLEAIVIPEQKYTKFTAGPGGMPEVLRGAWKEIWDMSEEELGGKRGYKADFEVYDERAADHSNIVLDIYIGIES